MFEPGTKVILVESSLHKTVGPRKGSIGYVSNSLHTRIIPIITEEFASFNVVASLCEIIFIRFGFEERGRAERKTVISLFPVIKNGRMLDKNNKNEKEKINFDVKEQVEDFCRMIASPKEAYLWEKARDAYDVSNNVPIVLATPISYDTTNLKTCDELEFKTWVTSHLISVPFIKIVSKTIQSLHFTKYNDGALGDSDMWDYLHRLTNDREFRGGWIQKSVEEREKCILLIRKLVAVILHNRAIKVAKGIGELQFVEPHSLTMVVYDTIGPYMYNKVATSLLTRMSLEFYWPEDAKKVVEDLNAVVSECLSLSDNMLRSNNGFGYASLISKK